MHLHNILLIAIAALVSAQQEGQTDLPTLVANTPSLSTLGSLLNAFPDIATLLASQEDVTLLAPNNEALAEITATGGIFDLNQAEQDPSLIEAILRYHVLREAVPASAVTETPQFLPTLLNYTVLVQDGEVTGSNVTGGQVIEVQLGGENVVLISGLKTPTNVVQADIAYNNGIVHIIDNLLTIPMSVSGILAPANLTALAGAATEAGLVPTLDGAADVTIFAPTNEAFQAIAGAAANLSIDALTAILSYHVVPGSVVYSTDIAAGMLTTLDGGNVTVSIDDSGAVFVNQARVINTDILVAGGVVHVIDSVLMPSMPEAQPSNATMSVTATEVPFTSGAMTATSIVPELATMTSDVAAVPTSGNATATGSPTQPPVPAYTGGAAGKSFESIAYAVLAGGAAALAYI